VLEGLEGVETIVGTQAETNILWIQEVFGKEDPSYEKILSMAKTWDAAVELIKLIPTDEPRGESPPETTSTESTDTWRETGIMEERDEVVDKDAEDVSEVYQRLINDGRAGGKRVLRGDQKTLLGAIDRTIGYRLIVFDRVFLSKGHATQIRLQREWSNALAESLRVPVVTMKLRP
jgi:hypothetical protein